VVENLSHNAPGEPAKSEESFILKRTSLLAIVAAACAALLPVTANGQLAKERTAPAKQTDAPTWEVFAGYGYTSLNQVNQSRYGLQGVNVSVTRNFGRFFGVTADGAYYSKPMSSGNPGDPTVTTFMAGPVLHGQLTERVGLLVHVLLGGAHTGGESMTPDVSFAGGMGVGAEYKLSKRLWLRASGDDIFSSFVSDPNHQGYSAHRRGNSRAAFGVAYKF
jgi:hypothetical protein